jgi:hypothetical protein
MNDVRNKGGREKRDAVAPISFRQLDGDRFSSMSGLVNTGTSVRVQLGEPTSTISDWRTEPWSTIRVA